MGDEVEVPRKRSPFSVDNQQPVETENRLESHAVAGATMKMPPNRQNRWRAPPPIAKSTVLTAVADPVRFGSRTAKRR